VTCPADSSLLPDADTSRRLHEELDLDLYGNNNVNQWCVGGAGMPASEGYQASGAFLCHWMPLWHLVLAEGTLMMHRHPAHQLVGTWLPPAVKCWLPQVGRFSLSPDDLIVSRRSTVACTCLQAVYADGHHVSY
jgi:hypothetical protein